MIYKRKKGKKMKKEKNFKKAFQEHRGVGPDQNLSCPHSWSEVSTVLGGHPREVRMAVTSSEGKDSDSSDSRKTVIILMC